MKTEEKMISKRWHIHYEGRTFIVYGDDAVSMRSSICATHNIPYDELLKSDLVPSGYYNRRTNTIYGAKDGDVIIKDWHQPEVRLG